MPTPEQLNYLHDLLDFLHLEGEGATARAIGWTLQHPAGVTRDEVSMFIERARAVASGVPSELSAW